MTIKPGHHHVQSLFQDFAEVAAERGPGPKGPQNRSYVAREGGESIGIIRKNQTEDLNEVSFLSLCNVIFLSNTATGSGRRCVHRQPMRLPHACCTRIERVEIPRTAVNPLNDIDATGDEQAIARTRRGVRVLRAALPCMGGDGRSRRIDGGFGGKRIEGVSGLEKVGELKAPLLLGERPELTEARQSAAPHAPHLRPVLLRHTKPLHQTAELRRLCSARRSDDDAAAAVAAGAGGDGG